jgi:CheY-like chemotaxis protein
LSRIDDDDLARGHIEPGLTGPLRTVLVAEDEDDDVVFLKRAVAHVGLGISVITVPDGEEAIFYLTGVPPYDDRAKYPLPSLVVLDLKMPRKSGLEVLQWMHENPGAVKVPVVVLSGSLYGGERQEALRLGAAGFFNKAVEPDDLEQTVKQIFTKFLPPPEDRQKEPKAGA